MTILFFFLFGCIAGALLCRQGPQGTPGVPGPQGPEGPSGSRTWFNLVKRQSELERQVYNLHTRLFCFEVEQRKRKSLTDE